MYIYTYTLYIKIAYCILSPIAYCCCLLPTAYDDAGYARVLRRVPAALAAGLEWWCRWPKKGINCKGPRRDQ